MLELKDFSIRMEKYNLEKHCNKCKTTKPITEFGKDRHGKNGFCWHCKECRNKYLRDYGHRKPEIRKKINAKNSERRKKEYYSNKRKFKDLHLQKHYNISIDDYDELFKNQNGVCAICSQSEQSIRNKSLCVDHCHITQKIRGLLCTNCNRSLGLLKDNCEILEKAKLYLKRYEK